ncbi:hypothetical protein SKAU_G00014160 [Synaphobranchus kaupii]|uniref:Uncharacterized protein n=1 Tax=Synaphobranchus kaupii TaxID=118154 RepID=A0A9Q1JCH3_SYNKA|nr:hypothetical protein SKAU_G00014160 [Synaphobranchus kaupii]
MPDASAKKGRLNFKRRSSRSEGPAGPATPRDERAPDSAVMSQPFKVSPPPLLFLLTSLVDSASRFDGDVNAHPHLPRPTLMRSDAFN